MEFFGTIVDFWNWLPREGIFGLYGIYPYSFVGGIFLFLVGAGFLLYVSIKSMYYHAIEYGDVCIIQSDIVPSDYEKVQLFCDKYNIPFVLPWMTCIWLTVLLCFTMFILTWLWPVVLPFVGVPALIIFAAREKMRKKTFENNLKGINQ